jgi:hypothetical protein
LLNARKEKDEGEEGALSRCQNRDPVVNAGKRTKASFTPKTLPASFVFHQRLVIERARRSGRRGNEEINQIHEYMDEVERGVSRAFLFFYFSAHQ